MVTKVPQIKVLASCWVDYRNNIDDRSSEVYKKLLRGEVIPIHCQIIFTAYLMGIRFQIVITITALSSTSPLPSAHVCVKNCFYLIIYFMGHYYYSIYKSRNQRFFIRYVPSPCVETKKLGNKISFSLCSLKEEFQWQHVHRVTA